MILLKNEFLIAEIELPTEGYSGSRFDRMGKVTQITDVNGNTYFTQEQLDREDTWILGKGLFGEFGIDMPIGYDECKIGEVFPKIGVGMIKRINDGPYDFFFQYDYVPFDIDVELISDTEVCFQCECKNVSYPFIYRKFITLVDNVLNVDYQLINKGGKVIRTNEYIHNFVSLNNAGVESGLSLCFDSPISKTSFEKGTNPNGILSLSNVESNVANFVAKPDSEFFFGGLVESPKKCKSWTLYNTKGVRISETVDFEVQGVNMWGSSHVVSPELFKNIVVNPYESLGWNRRYEFGSIS